MIFFILELVTCFKAGGPRLGLTMSQGATRRKSLGTTDLGGSLSLFIRRVLCEVKTVILTRLKDLAHNIKVLIRMALRLFV